ncbi:MAG: hypothetical protein EOO21_00780 [Comamonadaceae bacterium]|nr:MAG: hypothetical protein EOO21_00780 [Comamonadaceae bacterium]
MLGSVGCFTHCSNSGSRDMCGGEDAHQQEGYLTDLLSRRAIDPVERMVGQSASLLLSLH